MVVTGIVSNDRKEEFYMKLIINANGVTVVNFTICRSFGLTPRILTLMYIRTCGMLWVKCFMM
jgi:hypothetical protein